MGYDNLMHVAPARRLLPLAVAVLLLSGCGIVDPASPAVDRTFLNHPAGANNMDTAIVGSRVSLQAHVARVLSPGAFTIPPADNGTNHEVLVLNQNRVPVTAGQVVRISGRVDVLMDDSTAQRYGPGSLAQVPQLVEQRDIVADLVDTTPIPSPSR